jgi:hypothetical protein
MLAYEERCSMNLRTMALGDSRATLAAFCVGSTLEVKVNPGGLVL